MNGRRWQQREGAGISVRGGLAHNAERTVANPLPVGAGAGRRYPALRYTFNTEDLHLLHLIGVTTHDSLLEEPTVLQAIGC